MHLWVNKSLSLMCCRRLAELIPLPDARRNACHADRIPVNDGICAAQPVLILVHIQAFENMLTAAAALLRSGYFTNCQIMRGNCKYLDILQKKIKTLNNTFYILGK
jgi:hypothetical protein